MLADPPPHRIDAVRGFNRFYTRRIGVLTPGLLDSPFSLTEARVLFEIARDGGATATDLARGLDVDPGYLSRILAAFEDDGIIQRRQSAEDRRQWVVSLTAKGRKAFRALDERSSRQVESMLADVAAEDQRRLVTAMHTIEGILDPPTGDCPEAFLLRTHGPGDLGLVTYRHGVLYADEYGFDEKHEALVAEILVKFVRDHDPRRERLWIAERDGDFAGSIMCAKAAETVAQLRLLLVEPAARGHGLGPRLVEQCIRFARSPGYEKIVLWTLGCLHDARRLYERTGFCLGREEPHRDYGLDLTAQWWERAL